LGRLTDRCGVGSERLATEPVASEHKIERPPLPITRLGALHRDFGAQYATNGLIATIFSATGPVAVILAVGRQGGLSQAELASWIFGVFFANGLLTIVACWLYRQPLAVFFTIPGTVLVGPALNHLSWPEVIGAFFATGVLLLILGATGWVRRLMRVIPMPIVMGMVAGVFLRFGIGMVAALGENVAIAAPMVVVFVLLSAVRSLGRWIPPIIGALIVGALLVVLTGQFGSSGSTPRGLADPIFYLPEWSVQAMLELVIPLAITVLVVQNGQGIAILRAAGHDPPVNLITIACGIWTILVSAVGGVPSCLAGPSNALLTSSGARQRQYIAGICCGLLAVLFGLFAPFFTHLLLGTPNAFIAVLAGLAMLRVLQSAFTIAFGGKFTLGALVTFLVTVADISVLRIGAAFWGLVAGIVISYLLESGDFTRRADTAS
jgi:benzoate membrane transport protein